MIKNVPLLLLLFFCMPFIFSQETNEKVQISGKIIDAETNQILENASVAFQKENDTIIKGTSTDKNGLFSFNISKGTYKITVSYITFTTHTVTKNITNTTNLGTIGLKPDGLLDEVKIVAEKKLVEVKANKVIYNASADPANVGGSSLDVLSNAPNVRVDQENKVIVRGSEATVLINGKEQSDINSVDLLKSLPSNSIDRVEIIPRSAKYSAQGSGLIVNIITKKRFSDGFNGSFEVHTGIPDNHGFSTFLNKSSKKVNLYSTISYNYGDAFKKLISEQPSVNFLSNKKEDNINNRLLFNLGSDFYLTKNDIINASALINLSGKNNYGNTVASNFNRNAKDGYDDLTMEGQLGYTKNFKKKGKQLKTNFIYESYSSKNKATIFEQQTGNSVNQKSKKNQKLENFTASIDYSYPLSKNSKIQVGYKGQFKKYENIYKVTQLNQTSNLYEIINNLDNTFNYNENIHGLYSEFTGSKGAFSYNVGLRTEISNITIKDIQDNINKIKNYTNFFPSANIGYETGASYLSLFYSRYIERPSATNLSPFIRFTDQRFQYVGNSDLNPYYINFFQLGLDTSIKKIYLSTYVYASFEKDNFLSIYRDSGEQTINGDKIFMVNKINSGNLNIYGLEVNVSYKPIKNLHLNLMLSPYQLKTTKSVNNDYNITNNVFQTNFKALTTFNNGFKIQVSQVYQTSMKFGKREQKPYYLTKLTLSKDFLKKKALLALRFNDVFATNKFNIISNENTTRINRGVYYESPVILSFRYRFNQKRTNKKDRSNEIDKDKLNPDLDKL